MAGLDDLDEELDDELDDELNEDVDTVGLPDRLGDVTHAR